MALPFRSRLPRKYRCFVCGVDFSEYEEFKEHMIEEHEEGREYIICKFCGAPVRDMRLHYKVKHPGQKLQDGQMRATIWYDFSGRQRKRKTKKPPFKEGYHLSPKTNGELHYRSGYELEVYKCLDTLNEVITYEVEPKDCVTPYYWKGKWRKYWPDLKVHFVDGHIEVWEVKPSNQTDFDQNQMKWRACTEKVGERGWKFKYMTEQGINKLRKMIVEQHRSR